MFKQIRGLLLLVALAFFLPSLAGATATPAQQGGYLVNEGASSGGVCAAVTTGAVVTVVTAASARKAVTLYCTTAMNLEPGDSFGTAPTITPTTGAIGTGVGYPIVATTYVTIGAVGISNQSSVSLNLPPADRFDLIAASSNGYCCAIEQF